METSKEHEKTEKEVSEDEDTSSSRNTCDDSVSPCSSIQRNEVDAEQKALTHSKVDTQISDKCIQLVPGPTAKRKRVLCAVCLPYPTILKRFCYWGRVPPICLPEGTKARTRTIQEHPQSEAHKECLEAKRLKKLSSVEKSQTVPLAKMLSSQCQKLANKIGSLIIHVYNDAKCLTSSAFSWPSRVVAAKLAHKFNYNQPFQPYLPSDFDLQYIRPPVVQELLRTIVSSDLPKFKEEIHSCIAASMDKTQKDHQYMLLNVVDENGKPDLKFIGIGHVTDPGASGHLAALKLGTDDTVGFDETKRTSELEKTEGLTVRRFPKYFEVRWAEFTAALLDAILCSWQALIKFNVEQCDAEGKKFLKLLTHKDNIILMWFVADLLFLIKVFQNKLQSDSLTILDIEPKAEKFRERVNKLSTGSLLGGWGNEFKERYDEEANKFCGIKLWKKERRRPDTKRRENFEENEIKEVHRSIAPDLDLANVAIQYQDLQDCAEMQKADPFSMLQKRCKEQGMSIQMSVSSLAAFLHANPIQLIVSGSAALSWMEEKDRRARESTKAGKQEWFSKIFANDDKEDGERRKSKEKELKRKF
eukprot:gene10390-19087_t